MNAAMKLLWAGAALLALGACASASRFHWGDYEQRLYVYTKKPETRGAYQTALTAAIEKGEELNMVAPGFYAELGYLYLEDGETETAKRYFEKEMALFPESRFFLLTLIERMDGVALPRPLAPRPDDPAPNLGEPTPPTEPTQNQAGV